MHKTVTLDEAKKNLEKLIYDVEKDPSTVYIITINSIPRAILSSIQGKAQIVSDEELIEEAYNSSLAAAE